MNRNLPFSIKLPLLLNGKSGLIAIIILIIGSFASLGFFNSVDWQAAFYLNSNTDIGKGKIVDIYPTNVSINEEVVHAYVYLFDSPIGELEWTSYQQGYYYDVGDEVNVVYNRNRPYVNRIQGMSSNVGGWSAALLLIPFFVGLIWLIIVVRIGMKRLKIIQNGEKTEGKLVMKDPTNTRVNDQTVYKLIFQFPTKDGGTYSVSTSTHKTEKLEDEATEAVIYNINNPEQALLVDRLPARVSKYLYKSF